MPDEMHDRPVILTPREWRALLRYAGATHMSNDAVAELLQDPDGTPIDARTDAALRARMARPQD